GVVDRGGRDRTLVHKLPGRCSRRLKKPTHGHQNTNRRALLKAMGADHSHQGRPVHLGTGCASGTL
ncbi:hypothetical protein T265_02274, partial [Opisthorchis viverrini]